MSTWWAVVVLSERVPDPEDVTAGWTALAVFLLMGAAVVLLAFSLVKHLNRARANFAERDRIEGEDNP